MPALSPGGALAAAAATLRIRSIAALLVALACGGLAGRAVAEEAVLIASTTPGYAPGMVVTAQERLVLPDGASVTLLFRSGQMLRLRGPFDAALGLARPARREGPVIALAEAFRLRGVDASVIGGTRATGLGRARLAPAEVAVDAQRSGTWCVGPADTVWLTRPAAEPGSLVLRRGGNLRSLAWPAGATRIEWPSDVVIEDGDRFDLLAGGTTLATLGFRTVAGAGATDPAAVAEAMLLGCREQFEAALRRLARAAVPNELWLATDRGRQPTYSPGEPIGLTVMSAVDGWLYCVLVRANGAAVPVFPAGAVDGARLAGSLAVTIPGPRGGATLRAGPPGVEQLRCWLADRDVSPELPHALLDPAGRSLPDQLAATLDTVIAGIAGDRVATASLELRIVPAR